MSDPTCNESRLLQHLNNSEENVQAGQDEDDFTSFPTLPDPEQDHSKTLTNIFSKTLRKVTNNASTFVHNYSSPQSNNISSNSQSSSPIKPPTLTTMAVVDPTLDSDRAVSSVCYEPSVNEVLHNNVTESTPPPNTGYSKVDKGLIANDDQNELAAPEVAALQSVSMPLTSVEQAVVHSTPDFKSLRLPKLLGSKLQPPLLNTSATNSVINVNAVASTDWEASSIEHQFSKLHAPLTDSSTNTKEKHETILSELSKIFNNLPNDIELSEDSASDTDTINVSTISSPKTSSHMLNSDIYNDGFEVPSPVKAEGPRKNDVKGGYPSSLSTFHAINKGNHSLRKKQSSNLSSIFLDNAKHIINHNITGPVVSSASSIVPSKRLKKKKKAKKPKRSSENPLKNGGIPRKYWMNDSFVSDCLNCFKPFTAFRRKHHCRFCGQIFCSDCTLFISYKQHKEERKGYNKNKKKTYNDKLRVCRPCYSDVIVYLSDDSSSTSSSDSDTESSETNKTQNDDSFNSSNQLSRINSRSNNSRRASFISNSNVFSSRNILEDDTVNSFDRSPSYHIYPRSSSSPLSDLNTSKQSLSKFSNAENARTNSKHAPQMAIPTTRTGEAVEIPLSKYALPGAYHTSNINSSVTPSLVGEVGHQWFKNYSHLRVGNQPDLQKTGSFDQVYNNILSKKIGKYRILSNTDKNLKKERSKRGDFFTTVNAKQDEYDINGDDAESENEDEQVMSLYTSLNHLGYDNHRPTSALSPSAAVSNSSMVVPTLGDFPTIMANERLLPRSLSSSMNTPPTHSKFFHNNSPKNAIIDNDDSKQVMKPSNVTFLEELPNSDRLRSQERAHASLLRMKSRRKSKSTRNILILTQNNNRLPSFESSNLHNFPLSVSTPTSPTPNQALQSSQTYFNGSPSLHSKSLNIKDTSTGNLEPEANKRQDSVVESIYEHSSRPSFNLTLEELRPGDMALAVALKDERKLAYDDNENSELNLIYKDYLDSILMQCLVDCDVKGSQERWVAVLEKVLSNVSLVKVTDTLDIKQYIKIKKILGGTIEDTGIIDGLFMTKNIDSKSMASSIDNPKIALLMFPIEYLKQKELFISLRIIHAQQSVYISNLVSRLISLKPDIIVVGDSVCGLAEQLLEDANITVISNVKPQVIERISRYTKADIFQSINDLFFKKGSLGSCKNFEIRKYCFHNYVKSFAFFTGVEIEAGFTISLRGGDEDLLNNIKYAVETLIVGWLNSKFEQSFFKNLCLSFSISNRAFEGFKMKERVDRISCETQGDVSLDKAEVVQYIDLFCERKISLSPAVRFPIPSTLSKVIDSYEKYTGFKKTDVEIQAASDNSEVKETWITLLKIDLKFELLPDGKSDLLNIVKFVSASQLRLLLNEYLLKARAWSNCMKLSTYQLYPVFHKSIHLLYSMVSIKFATPCLGPSTIAIDYYSDNDKCLGIFLDQSFQDSTNTCDECGDLLLNHYKSYAHGNGKLDFILEKYDNVIHHYEGKNRRVMWSYCRECNQSTPIVPMNDDTYYLSVGKFFELAFWGSNVAVTEKVCEHDYFKSYIKCFGYMNLVIRVEFSEIDSYEVVVPKKQIQFMPEIDIKLKVESWAQIKKKSENFFQSIYKRLNRVKVDTYEKAEDGLHKIEELKQKAAEQAKSIESKTLDLYYSTSPTDRISLNSILRDLQKLGVEWDNEFNEFEELFLPSENEITKITQFHLKNFLMDRYNNDGLKEGDFDSGSKSVERSISEQKKVSEEKGEQPDEGAKTLPNSENKNSEKDTEFSSPINKEKSNEIGKMIPSSLYQKSNLLDRINKMEQLLLQEQSGSSKEDLKKNAKPKKQVARKGSEASLNQSNKVTQLANFFNQMNFDQISMEFKKQREKELQKKLHKFKALPILESKPIVEIYNKIEDVVDVNDEEKNTKKLLETKVPSLDHFGNPGDSRDRIPTPKTVKDSERMGETSRDKSFDRSDEKGPDLTRESKDKNLEIPQPERQSLLKSLTNFWADRSATLWDPLDYPLDSSEHTFADSDVIVREDEPTSLVALCLSSNDYKQKIKKMEEDGSVEDEKFEVNDSNNTKIKQFIKIEKKFKKNSNKKGLNDMEKVMIKNKSNHLKYQFVDGNMQLSCKIFYSEHFEAFRTSCGNNESFIQSLSRCIKWNSSGGKSGSNFLKTLDNRYIVKELSKSELESFVSIAPFYFKYISQSMFNTLTTAIAKIFGFYQVEIKNSVNGKTFKMDFLIMENLFYGHNTTRIFDLKGSMRNRHVKQTGKENEVLLDENMIEYIYESPVFVQEHLKRLLRGSLFNDTSFLSAMEVMDYSLVIGIDDSSKKLYIGIIDWLRTFTWDKKVENWVKGNNLIGRKGKDPTIVTPKQYRIRFREAMERYILEVPDIWYEGK
ncbi:uncharacterized protein PRCAT00001008001 [Priceomyces carsonii]|uniref:uncharacterized protein n=1 Tax=Priceomyces carsonii TaxID=28549 RepID=UPI002EDB0D52|nr:unnamed protein product [Priceomyces carsonii]